MEDHFGHELSETDDTASPARTCRHRRQAVHATRRAFSFRSADMPSAAVTHSGYSALPARVGGRAFHATLFARAHVSRDSDAELPAGRASVGASSRKSEPTSVDTDSLRPSLASQEAETDRQREAVDE